MEINITAPKGFRLTGEFREAKIGEWRWSGDDAPLGEPVIQKPGWSDYKYFILEPVVPKRIVLEQCEKSNASCGCYYFATLDGSIVFWNPSADDYEWYKVVTEP